jgi:uncharacterized protein YjlB
MMETHIEKYYLQDDGTFPNNKLPVLHYKGALKLPRFFPARMVKRLFSGHNWKNNWRAGIYTYHHYHSVTHEALAVIKGKATLLLGGENGRYVAVEKGDVLVIPAGVSHKNTGKEKDIICVGGYPGGKDYDMNYGKPGERPQADINIASLPIPSTDPIGGPQGELPKIWAQV